MKIAGWGRYPTHEGVLRPARDDDAVARETDRAVTIARGNGRAYGDAAIGAGATLDMRRMDRMISFDPETGRLVAEAGTLLADVIAAFLPQGFFPLVTPGTKFVTLGGMIAADVHGKNHHKAGSMAACVDWIDLMGPDGEIRRLSRDENAELFHWTIGGMGLTGVILRAAIRLQRVESAWIRQTLLPAPDLEAAMELFEANSEATYSVAWIDCLASGAALGRSLLMLGEHATLGELDNRRRARPFHIAPKGTRTVPFDFPSWALNRYTIRAFNGLYWWKNRRGAGTSFIDWDTYFYPLDAILGWNRIYGRRGFAQFQCVLPLDASARGLREILRATAEAGQGSFLAVLKRMGPGRGGLSFPMEGYTLALDFPAIPRALALVDRLYAIAAAHGGRFYLAKDARMTPDLMRSSDPRVADFQTLRGNGLAARFASHLSERLKL